MRIIRFEDIEAWKEASKRQLFLLWTMVYGLLTSEAMDYGPWTMDY